MYIPSPMEAYNKNNPFVIIAKRRYDNILDLIDAFSKKTITGFIVLATMLLLIITAFVVFIIRDYDIMIYLGFVLICIIMDIALFLYMKSLLKKYIHKEEAMVEFNRLSELSVNQILVISNEDILKCLNLLYYMEGKFSVETRVFLILQYIVGFIQIVANAVISTNMIL